MKHFIIPLLVLIASCQSNPDIFVKARFEGKGLASSNGEQTLVIVQGQAWTGVYQVNEAGELRLTRPLIEAVDTIRIINSDLDQDESFPLSQPLPAWTEALIRNQLTPEDVQWLGLIWASA